MASIPFSIWFHFYFMLVKRTSAQVICSSAKMPENALVCAFHPEWPLFPASKESWDRLVSGLGTVSWLGIHHFLSYVGSFSVYWWRCRAVRYDWRSAEKPFQQILRKLQSNTDTVFVIRTDSGRPYNRVRSSIVAMSDQLNRPVVCVRQWATRYVMWNEHYIPLPFGRISTAISEPISPETLRALSKDEALSLLQKTMDHLGEILEKSPNGTVIA